MVHCEAPTSSNSSLCSAGSSFHAMQTMRATRARSGDVDCSRRLATLPIPTYQSE